MSMVNMSKTGLLHQNTRSLQTAGDEWKMSPRAQGFVAISNMLLLRSLFRKGEKWTFERYNECCEYGEGP